MYIIGQSCENIVNSDHVECFYENKVPESGLTVVYARTHSLKVMLGIYRTKKSADKAMANLGLALLAGESMHAFAMPEDPSEDLPEGIVAANESLQPSNPVQEEGGKENGQMESDVPAAGGA